MKKVFFSFHYEKDNWRVQQIKNMGVVDNQVPVHSNAWEQVKLKTGKKIQKWIDDNIKGCSCLVVLIGSETANRKWVLYEIEKAWNEGKGVLGIYIHQMLDQNRSPSPKGDNPFDKFQFILSHQERCIFPRKLEIPVHDCEKINSIPNDLFGQMRKSHYDTIKENLAHWVEQAIHYRNNCAEKIQIKP
ncbi:TIR domain-containing protein [Moraxella marmotae]|uniref:TIR domain-containing protein n=1 Tax=Moraxella marmotae TaxID=3344520 RepID=UPI0035F442C8